MKHKLILFSVLLINFNFIETALRTWIGGDDALVEHSQSGCSGLILPEYYTSVIFLKKSVVSKVLLPQTGGIALESGASLIFDEKDHSCKVFELKKTNLNRPENWNPLGNRAIPYLDRLPCQWDAVVIPHSKVIGIEAMQYRVRSIKILDKNVTDPREMLLHLFHAQLSMPNSCTRDTCLCQPNHMEDDEVCASLLSKTVNRELLDLEVEFPDEPNCHEPIFPMRSCNRICGAVIEIEGESNKQITKKIEQVIKNHENRDYVDYSYGLAQESDANIYGQFIIVDKEEKTGGSYTLEIAKKIKELLKNENHIKILTSKEPIIFGSFASSGVGMILITLALVIFAFLAIYMAFMTPAGQFDIRNMRINAATFRPFVFARFDNTGEVVDGDGDGRRVDIAFTHSARTSAALETPASPETHERSFDNPLYGKPIGLDSPTDTVEDISSLDIEANQPSTSKGKKQRKPSFEPLLSIQDDDEDDEEKHNEVEIKNVYSNSKKEGKQETLISESKDKKEIREKTSEDSSDEENNSTEQHPVNKMELLKFIEDNMQQVNLLDEQL